MKRKDLKPGEWYLNDRPMDGPAVAIAALGTVKGEYLDMREDSGSVWAHPDDDVTPCDPPEWFSEMWVRREG
jgi:hypothetical protein